MGSTPPPAWASARSPPAASPSPSPSTVLQFRLRERGPMSEVCIAVPVYQGAATVADVVRGARASGLPVVVVDDGSSDGSGALAAAAGATVLRHPANHGK